MPRKKNLSDEEKKAKRREQKKMTMRRLRAKENLNPAALEERRRKDRERYHKKKEQKKVKTIEDYTPREQRVLRRKWREKAQKYREKQKMLKRAQKVLDTPPSSPGPSHSSRSRILSGRKVAARNRKRLLAENIYLKSRLHTLESKIAKYRMKVIRHTKKIEGLPREGANKSCDTFQDNGKESLKKEVECFLEDDESSRLTAGKKETITRNKQKKQIRLLNDTMQNLHKKFKLNINRKISYSLFCKYRPFWVLIPNEKTRNTCLCIIHTNVSNLVKTMKNSKMINSSTPLELVKTICCNENNKLKELCLERKCQNCIGKDLIFNQYNEEDKVLYEKWGSKRVNVLVRGKAKICQKTIKETVLLSKKEAADMIKDKIFVFMQHQANISHQYKEISQIKLNLTHEEALLHIDYSENYTCKYGEEIQSAHFGGSKPQICLHTSVLYYRDTESGLLKSESLCTMSENLRHDPVLVCAHLDPIFERLKTLVPNLKSLHMLSDGATTQYRNKSMFHLVINHICLTLNLEKFMWHYSESGHGKGAPDGVGGCIKRTADRGAALGKDVNDFEKLVSYLLENCRGVTIIPINDRGIDDIEERLKDGNTPPFKGTLKIHQVLWSYKSPLILRVRRLSCLKCSPDEHCSDYEIGVIKTVKPIEDNTEAHVSQKSIDISHKCQTEEREIEEEDTHDFQIEDDEALRLIKPPVKKPYLYDDDTTDCSADDDDPAKSSLNHVGKSKHDASSEACFSKEPIANLSIGQLSAKRKKKNYNIIYSSDSEDSHVCCKINASIHDSDNENIF